MPRAPIQDLSPAEIRRLAADALVLGFPLILTDTVRRIHPMGGNKLVQLPDNAGAIAPGLADEDALTVGSSIWLDVTRGPVIANVPSAGDCHLSIALYDPWARPIQALGLQGAHHFNGPLAIVGVDWAGEAETGMTARRLPGASAWMVARMTPRSAGDGEACRRLLSGLVARSESQAWPSGETLSIEPPPRTAVETALALGPATFLHRLAMLLSRHPAPDQATAQGLARLGVTPGIPYSGLDDSRLGEAVALGFRDGADHIVGAAAERMAAAEGWKALHSPPTDADPLSRAATAATSLGAPPLDDVLSLACCADASGQPLRGSERYLLSFPPGGAPPAHAFWSLSLRSPHHSRDLAANRSSVGDREPLRPNADGGLEIVLQHSPPPADRFANWLPVPPGEFSLVLRLYWPKAAALDGEWRPPLVTPLGDQWASTPDPLPQQGAKS